jgi:hypothetical protein
LFVVGLATAFAGAPAQRLHGRHEDAIAAATPSTTKDHRFGHVEAGEERLLIGPRNAVSSTASGAATLGSTIQPLSGGVVRPLARPEPRTGRW